MSADEDKSPMPQATNRTMTPGAMPADEQAALLTFAHRLADAARQETLSRFRSGIGVENKDRTSFDPVTEADRQAEAAMRDLIGRQFPDHGISGEEMEDVDGSGSICWVLDPIDGTRSFVAGWPLWGTLIAACEDDRPLIGIIDHPALDERYAGGPAGAFANDRAIRTRQTTKLEGIILSTTDPYLLTGNEREAFNDLRRQASVTRYGGDCYGYALLAAGHLDLVVESGLATHDVAALVPVVEGAGGVITNWAGGAAIDGGRIVASATPQLHDKALGRLTHIA